MSGVFYPGAGEWENSLDGISVFGPCSLEESLLGAASSVDVVAGITQGQGDMRVGGARDLEAFVLDQFQFTRRTHLVESPPFIF